MMGADFAVRAFGEVTEPQSEDEDELLEEVLPEEPISDIIEEETDGI